MISIGFEALLPMAQTTPKTLVLVPMFLLIIIVGSLEDKDMRMKETNMVIYMHDRETGPNATAVWIAGVNGIGSNPTSFGTIVVVDDAITIGVDRHSKEIGRARGIFAASALDGSASHWLFSIVFTDGEYKGSMLQIQGLEIYFDEHRGLVARRELSVVSGTGSLRYARGYVVMESSFLDIPNFITVFKLTVSVLHY